MSRKKQEPTESPVVSHMRAVANRHHYGYVMYTQDDIVDAFPKKYNVGVCFGLSAIFMDIETDQDRTAFVMEMNKYQLKHSTQAGKKYFFSKCMKTNKELVAYIRKCHDWQKKTIDKKRLDQPQWQLAMRDLIDSQLGLEYLHAQFFNPTPSVYVQLSRYLMTEYDSYCMILIPGHAMAALCEKGVVTFFDPNGGIASPTKKVSENQLAQFFLDYMERGHPIMRAMYCANAPHASFWVFRFKKPAGGKKPNGRFSKPPKKNGVRRG